MGYVLTKEAGLTLSPVPLQIRLLLRPPDRKARDTDNVYSAFKSYQDGIFNALELNDRLIRKVAIEWADPEPEGAIYVQLTELEE